MHNFRHTIATHLCEHLGVAPYVVSLVPGHTPPGPAVSRIYNRSERLARATGGPDTSWAAWLEALRGRQAPARVLPLRGGR